MRQGSNSIVLAVLVSVTATFSAWANGLPYEQNEDLVYSQIHGIGLLMDVFVPTGEKNGIGIIDVASGAWHSDRGKIRDHKLARMYDVFCGKGYTVFAIRPGSSSKFTALEMLHNVKTGIRFVKAHADQYGIDPDRLGITGASAGGHLASLAVVTAEDANPNARDALRRYGTHVAAAGIFFPPTNFLQWGETKPPFERIGSILFNDGVEGHSTEEIEAKARAISPALQVNGKTPPFLIWHGDADPLVPLQQSEFFVEKLKAAGTDVEFHIKPGGGHPWMTIPEEVEKMGDWFDRHLAPN